MHQIVSMNTIYRPVWTCGRYDASHKAAIFYNLIEGISYFFEDASADVVGEILSLGRICRVSVNTVAENTGISKDSIIPFFEELASHSLLTFEKPTAEGILDYRNRVGESRRAQGQTTRLTTKEKLPMDVSNAEMDYTDRVGGITSVMFELTYNCSEKCIHCYNIGATRNDNEVSHRADLQEISLSDYKRVIDELYALGLVKVCLSGGDPFSRSFAWDIIDYLYSKDIAFDVFTNGQRLTADTERLANYYPRVVGISLYSGNSSTHDRITRTKGSWDKTTTVIRQLAEMAVPIQLKCCVMRPNVHDYFTVSDFAKRYGLLVQYELNVSDSIDGDKCASQYLRLTPEQLRIVLRDDNTPMYVGKEAPNFGGQPKIMTRKACGAGENTFCLTPDGNLIPCCAFHLTLGNVTRQSVAEIYTGSEVLKRWNSTTLEQYEECGTHDYCDYCNLCAGNNFSEHGIATKASENNCYMAKCRWRLAHDLMKGEDVLSGKSVRECLECFRNEVPQDIKRVATPTRES